MSIQNILSGDMGSLLLLGFICAVFYVLIIRPQQKKEKDRLLMIEQLKKGSVVMLSSGILGVVVSTQKEFLELKTHQDQRLWVSKKSVGFQLHDMPDFIKK
jgi:preprotein translocase subunit YajC